MLIHAYLDQRGIRASAKKSGNESAHSSLSSMLDFHAVY